MAAFEGHSIIVTLKQGSVLQGLVQSVDPATSSLALENAFSPLTGQQFGTLTVQGPNIADLQIVHTAPGPVGLRSRRPSVLGEYAHPDPQPAQPEDPAILSYTREPTAQTKDTPKAHAVVQESLDSRIVGAPTAPAASRIVSQAASQHHLAARGAAQGKGTLRSKLSSLAISRIPEQERYDDTDDAGRPIQGTVRRVSLTKTRTGKSMDDDAPPPPQEGSKRRQKKKRNENGVPGRLDNGVSSAPSQRPTSSQYRGKGWRQTPMLEDSTVPNSPQAKLNGRNGAAKSQRSKKQRALEKEAQNNGWATEDATDVQELPEFDFAANLSLFDKYGEWERIRKEDTTADEDRLVHFNRAARPGTNGGRNFHPLENVLDSVALSNVPQQPNSDTDFDGFDAGSGSKSATNMHSRASSKRAPVRQGSFAEETGPLKDFPRSARSIRAAAVASASSSHGAAGSPNPPRFTPPASPAGSQVLGVHFRISTTDRPCPTIMPAGMAAIEEVAETEFGLTTNIMTENAGRGIAEVAMATMQVNQARRGSKESISATKDTRPWALIIAGNHKSGARALAACRHLRSRNIRTLTCLLGFERQTVELEREVRKQADILVKMNGYVRGWSETRNYLASEGQPNLVIDALMSSSKPFDVLGAEDQKSVSELVNWANQLDSRRCVILSVDMPSGINGSTGEPSMLDPLSALPLYIPTHHIICIAAPRIGLLRALQKLRSASSSAAAAAAAASGTLDLGLLAAQVWVVDIGVEKAWKRSGLAGSRGVRFGSEWVVPVRLVEGGNV